MIHLLTDLHGTNSEQPSLSLVVSWLLSWFLNSIGGSIMNPEDWIAKLNYFHGTFMVIL